MKFLNDESGFGNIIYGAIGLVVFIILVASVIMPQIFTANQSGWDASTIAMWGILPIVVIASVLLFVIGKK